MDATLGAGSKTLEVRWIRRGQVPAAMLGWLAPFDDEVEEREDRYLDVPSRALGVKIKGGVQLDVKAFRGSPGEIELPGGSRGRLETWEKWTFPLDALALPPTDAEGWIALEKLRRRRSFRMADGAVRERPVSEATRPGCAVELTEVAVGAAIWWTLGLEAGGRPDTLEPMLRATVDALIEDSMPAEIRLELADSMSYTEWLGTGSTGEP